MPSSDNTTDKPISTRKVGGTRRLAKPPPSKEYDDITTKKTIDSSPKRPRDTTPKDDEEIEGTFIILPFQILSNRF